MDETTWPDLKELFLEALERPADERHAWLREAAGPNDALRREVEAMLAAHEAPDGLDIERRFLAEHAGGDDDARDTAREGDRVGAWRLVRKLGEGGMGEVWLGERADGQYEQQAAVKLVRPGYRAAEMLRRFDAERRILARLSHPNVARLLDGGVANDGRPYLVMEYVDGVPFTTYVEERGVGVRRRLELFRTVCDAVAYAHANLIVHRDLKPANLLVGADGRPMLLDFGIAKLLDPDPEGDETEATRPVDRVLTPEHAAPEQLRGERVTTATDVWGLGVLFYELLTGQRPFRFATRSPTEIERIVATEEPPPPSAAVTARPRRGVLRGDLDAIAMRALRKEPGERYASAHELAEDVGRWLEGLPVVAVRDSFGYRARKFLRRHRGPLAAGATIVALLATVAVTSHRQAIRVAVERDRALAAQRKAEEAVAMLVRVFETSNPVVDPGGDTLRVADLLVRAEKDIAALESQPDLAATLLQTLGSVHRVRARYDRAEELFGKALEARLRVGGEDDIEAARLRHELAQLAFFRRPVEEAEPLLRASVEQLRRLLEPSDPDLAVAIQDLAAAVPDDGEAFALLDEALALRRAASPPDSMALAASLHALAVRHLERGDTDAAEPLFRETLDVLRANLPAEHPHVQTVLHNLANLATRRGDTDTAERIQRELLETTRQVFGPDSPQMAARFEGLGTTLAHAGRHEEAVEAFRESVERFERNLGEHDRTANAVRNVGRALHLAGRSREGLAYLDRAVGIARRLHGPESADVAEFRGDRALIRARLGRIEGALEDAGAALAIREGAVEPDPENVAAARLDLGIVLLASGRGEEAEPLFRSAAEAPALTDLRTRALRAQAEAGLGAALVVLGRSREGRPLLERALPELRSWKIADPLLRELAEQAMSNPEGERRDRG